MAGSSLSLSEENGVRSRGAANTNGANANGEEQLWNPTEERYYGQRDDSTSSLGQGSGRWRYPANFDDALPTKKKSVKKEKKEKKDRWARTEDAYTAQGERAVKRKKSSKKKRRSVAADPETYSQRSESTSEFPEDPEAAPYGDRRPPNAEEADGPRRTNDSDIFNHEL